MRRHAGQAVRFAGHALHGLLAPLVAVGLLAALGLGALAWRLSQGPLELPWAIPRAEEAASALAGTGRVGIGSVSLVWQGFQAGVDRPLEIHLANLTWRDPDGHEVARVAQADVALAVAPMLRGRIAPRSIAIAGAQLRVTRTEAGALSLSGATPADTAPDQEPTATAVALLDELARPPGDGGGMLSALRRLRLDNIALSIVDRGLDTVWQVPRAAVTLERGDAGGVTGSATLDLALAGRILEARASVGLKPGGSELRGRLDLPAIRPADLAQTVPRLAPLADLDLPVELTLQGSVDTALTHPSAALTARLGAGRVRIGQGVLPLAGGLLHLDGTLRDADLRIDRLDLDPGPGRKQPRLTGWAHLRRGEAGNLAAVASLSIDGTTAADLPALWPVGVGGKGTRPWLAENLTDGVFTNFHADIALTAQPDLSGVTVTYLSGGLDGTGATIHWLRPVPPVEQVQAHLRFADPDRLVIDVASGRQTRMGPGPPMQVLGGRVTISGLSVHDQFMDIDLRLAGPVPEMLAVLSHKRLHLFDRHPLPFTNAAGQATGRAVITRLPLEDNVTVDDIRVQAAMTLTKLHLGQVVAGQDLDDGTFELTANNDGLQAKGSGLYAGVRMAATVAEDFRDGPANQITQRIGASGLVPVEKLALFGLDTGGRATGSVGLKADVTLRRNKRGEVALTADLAPAAIRLADLNWSKPEGVPGTLQARLRLEGDRLAGVDQLRAEGSGFSLDAGIDFAAGHPSVAHINRVVLGQAVDASGEIGWPAREGAPWSVTLRGARIDASAMLTHSAHPPGPPQRGPAWTADLGFERVAVANGATIYGLALRGASDGWINSRLEMIGRTASGGGNFRVAITPDGTGRALNATADDAGTLLRALDVVTDMRGGQMTLTGRYDDTRADHRLAGTAVIRNFAVRNGAGFGKLLQAISVYGLIDAITTPDLAFDEFTAPFSLAGDTLEVSDARAWNASLGMTGKGRADLNTRRVDLQGTIVPAYFINSLLGKLPLIGKLLSPEKGGGLIAANWTMRGSFDDPAIGVNPLSAITPGFLRGLFGVFDSAPTIPGPGDPPPQPRPMPTVPPGSGQQ